MKKLEKNIINSKKNRKKEENTLKIENAVKYKLK